MGLKSGILIGLILLLTVLGSFIFMKLFAIDLQRISLGRTDHRTGYAGR